MISHPLIAVIGPTASGKSDTATALAEMEDGEVISCDSMAVYRGMDIGTAKVSQEIRARIPHHLIDVADISERYELHTFLTAAKDALDGIRTRGRRPILCGGTGLYARAFIYDYTLLPHDADIAAAVKEEYDTHGAAALKEELDRIDPDAGRLAGANPRRLQRAVEAIRIIGKPIHHVLTAARNRTPIGRQFLLAPPVPVLRERIRQRTERMLAEGWIDETRALMERGLADAPTASQALGYKLIMHNLRAQISDVDELQDRIVSDTVRYTKRQRTWFRHQHVDAAVLELSGDESAQDIAEMIRKCLMADCPSSNK